MTLLNLKGWSYAYGASDEEKALKKAEELEAENAASGKYERISPIFDRADNYWYVRVLVRKVQSDKAN